MPLDPPPRRRATGAVLLAVVFLTVIGASAGYIAGKEHLNGQRIAAQGYVDPTPPAPTSATSGSAAPAGRACPKETQDGAVRRGSPGGLVQVLHLLTARAGESPGSQVWICRDSAGKLWYQGQRRSPDGGAYPQVPLREGDNALLLGGVQPEGDGFVATNTDQGRVTTYRVDARRLVIVSHNGSSVEEYATTG
jgi:hypothetical protein